jgi:queuine tRNA-ribosyltransferase
MKAGEILGMMLLTQINVAYYQELMAGLREAIEVGRLADFIGETKEGWARGEEGYSHRQ